MKNKILSKIFIAALFMAGVTMTSCGDTSTAPPETNYDNLPDQDISLIYDNVAGAQTDYILSLVDASGAIKDNSESNAKITPYFGNFAAMALLKNPNAQNIEKVKNYILWYIKHLNSDVNPVTGAQEIPGTIYDYYVHKDTEGKYDSADSYAATFLMLVNRLAATGQENAEWLKPYSEKIALVASALLKCIDTPENKISQNDCDDYLSVVSPVSPDYCGVKFLMDNCETNCGLKAAEDLKQKGLISNDAPFADLVKKNAESIKKMYANNFFSWNKTNQLEKKMNWGKFYPDAVCQLYPVSFDIIGATDNMAGGYAEFNNHYSAWASGKMYETYPWAFLAFAASKMGDTQRLDKYLIHINSLNIMGMQKPMWYSLEAAFVIFAIDNVSAK